MMFNHVIAKHRAYVSRLPLFLMIICVIILSVQDAEALTVTFLNGKVFLLRGSSKKKITMSTQFHDGDIVETGTGSMVVLSEKTNASRITVREQSRLLIDRKAIREGSTSLLLGTMTTKFTKLKKGARTRKVYTPTTVCAVRGTEFTVGVGQNGNSKVQMEEGTLDVYNQDGKVEVSGKQKADIVTGRKPRRTKDARSIDEWKKAQDAAVAQKPDQVRENYEAHIRQIKEKTHSHSNQLSSLQTSVQKLNKTSVAMTGKKLAATEQEAEDYYMLNRSTGHSIDAILKTFKDSKGEIYESFNKVKEESNQVLELQQKNLENIRKIKEAFQKQRDQIMKTHQDLIKDIKDRSKFE
jgi:hypothetical protein